MASKKGAAASIKWVALLQTNWGVISSVKEHFAVLPIFLTLYRHLFFLPSCPDAHLKALYTEPSKSQYSISPLVLVIFKSPTPTVVDTTLVTLVITILPLVITISPLNNPTCTNGRCKLL